MKISNNVSLKNFNSFGLLAKAKKYISFSSEEDLQIVLDQIKEMPLVLGGGSNMLLINDEIPLVLKNEIKGIKIIKEAEAYVLVEIGAGENWHQLVMWTMENDLGGIENLALIPGNAGAAPIQNIGAYGVELKDVFHSLWCVDRASGQLLSFHKNECQFGYRSSIFKLEKKDKTVITKIILKLSKKGFHTINSSYGAIEKKLEEHEVVKPSIQDIANAVIEIRTSKLPDPQLIGNAGSFFKNPVVDKSKYDALLKTYPEAPGYPLEDGSVKLAAGWLIDQCGWKGKQVGNTGCYKNQALVLVNHGNATGKEIYAFSKIVQESVKVKFDIEITAEVNLIQ